MFEDLEKELGGLVPREPSAGLEERIAAEVARGKFSRGDRWLMSVMSAGAAAAVVIVTLMMTDISGTERAPVGAERTMTVAETPRLLAQVMQDSAREGYSGPSTIPNGGGL